MTSTVDAAPPFEEAFKTLVAYLQTAVKANRLVSIPEKIERPCRSISKPSDSSLLRPLLKLFDGKEQHHLFQLTPKSFCGILFIVLHFSYSTAQDKLLHIFKSAMESYGNVAAVQNALQKCGIGMPDKSNIDSSRQAISDRLLHSLLRKLVSGGVEKQQRWTTTLLISSLIRKNKAACDRLTSYSECKNLISFVQDLEDYVGGILVCNLIRELLFHGVKSSLFWSPDSQPQIATSFPVAQHSSSAWLADLRRFFSNIDSSIGFNVGRQRLFAVTELVRTRGSLDQPSLNLAAVVTDELVLIVPQSQDTLQLVSIPLRPASTMIISRFSELTDNDCSIRISFPTDEGFEVCNGVKAALSGLLMTYESADDAQEAHQMLQDVQQHLSQGHVDGPKNYNQDVVWEPKKSIAFLNLWSPGKTIRSDRSKLDQATSDSEASDTQELSPLQHRSQRLNTAVNVHCPAQAEFHSDSETASEIDRLETVQNTRSLTDRLKLSQGGQKDTSNHNMFHKRVDVVAGDVPSQRSTDTGAVSERDYKEGTTVKTAHLPNKHVQGANIAGSKPLSHSRLSSIPRESAEERKLSKQGNTGPTASTAASKQAVPVPRPTRSSPFKLSSVPSSATTSSTTKRVDGGPMARLNGYHSQQKETASQSKSSLNEGLKRKSAASKASKKTATDNIDWEQDLQDGHEFDFPGDQESDEAPSKKRRKTGKKPAVKTTTQKTSNHNILPKKKPQVQKSRGSKTKKDERPSQAPEQTVAATRTRRTAPKSSRYLEVSSSDTNEAMDTMPTYRSTSPVDTEEGVCKRPKKKKSHSGAATPIVEVSGSSSVTKSARKRQKQPEIDTKSNKAASNVAVEPAVSRMKTPESTYARGSQNAQSTEGLTADSDTTKAPQNLRVEQPNDYPVNGEEAQDSHPIDESIRLNAVSADTSFGKLLATQLQSLDRSANENKDNLPPQARTPFGNESQFINTINHHKKRSTFPQADKLPPTKASVKTAGKSAQSHAVRPSVSPTKENSWSTKPAVSVVETEPSKRPSVYRVSKARGNLSEQPIFIDSDNLKVCEDPGEMEISKKPKIAEPPKDSVSTIVSAVKARNQIEKHRFAQSSEDGDDRKKSAVAAKETAFDGEDFGNLQNHDNETSESLIVTKALSPTKSAVQTEQKDALRSDGTKRATSSKKVQSHQTPHAQKLRAREDPVSEEQSEKSSVIRFSKAGPLYQDVQVPRALMKVASPMAPPPETSRHHQAKRQGLVTSEATPSRRLEAFVSTTENQGSYRSEDDDEGLTVEADTESRHLIQKDASIDANDSHPINGQSQPAALSASDQNHSVYVHRRLPAEGSDSDESAGQARAAEGEEEASESPSSDGEDVSEYEEGSKIINEHSETDDFAIEDSESRLEGPEPLDDTPQHPTNAAMKTTRDPVKDHTLISDGITRMIDSIHPGAAEGITTKPFKPNHHQSAKPSEIIDSNRSTETDKANLKSKADEIDASSTEVDKMMPPPLVPEQRVSSQKKQSQNTSPANDNAGSPRFSNPICDLPTGSEVNQSNVSQFAARSGPRRVPRRSKTATGETAIPVSATPEPMHVKFAEPSMQQNTTIWHQSNGSHLSERTGDSTLVNTEQHRYEREMTDTSDGSVSPFSRRMSRREAGLWRAATQGPHRDLMGHVMQIADDVLLRLGDEEDAVRAKMSEYKQGAAKLTTQAFNTQNESFTYEINQLRTSLNKARESLKPGLDDIGTSDKGVEPKWNRLSNLKSVNEGWDKRTASLLQSLDTLEVEEGGKHKFES